VLAAKETEPIVTSRRPEPLRIGHALPRVRGPNSEDREKMSNRAIWNVRLRHVWLATPLKGKRLKRRQRIRIGLEDALARKAKAAAGASAPADAES
jgi:hypothetical protein